MIEVTERHRWTSLLSDMFDLAKAEQQANIDWIKLLTKALEAWEGDTSPVIVKHRERLEDAIATEREHLAKPEVPERFLAEAYAYFSAVFTQKEHHPDSWQSYILERLMVERYDAPEVRIRAYHEWLKDRANALKFAYVGGVDWHREETKRIKYDKGHELKEISGPLKHYIDEGGPSNGGWMPSELLEIGMCALGPRDGNKMLEWATNVARERYRDGFYADPFTNDPRGRAA